MEGHSHGHRCRVVAGCRADLNQAPGGNPCQSIGCSRIAPRDCPSCLARRVGAPHPRLGNAYDQRPGKHQQYQHRKSRRHLGGDHAVISPSRPPEPFEPSEQPNEQPSDHSETFSAEVMIDDTADCTAGLRTTF
jgi:hypothetical protein